LKTIANLADATLKAVRAGFFPARWILACVLHSVRGGGGQVVYTQFRANATTHRAVVPTEDPPFGGLWCDQPAIFLLAEIACGNFGERAWGENRTPAKSVVFARGA
jgi:hypothetical protein